MPGNPGKKRQINGLRVVIETQMMPIFNSIADQVAVPGLSQVMSSLMVTMYRECKRKIEAMQALLDEIMLVTG